MIVDHSRSAGLVLAEPDDFKGFKLRLRGAEARRPALPGIVFVDDDNVLIGIDTVTSLPGAPSTAAWREGFDRMVAYAATKGWIDTATHAIRAHVERVS